MYRVIVKFIDKHTKTKYGVGDEFPCADEARVKALSTNANDRGYPLIEYVEDRPVKKQDPVEEPVEIIEEPKQEPAEETKQETAEEPVKPKRGRKKNG